MLTALAIRDVVLIEALDLEFGAGLTVLTGETGAGKSILLDALGLALGGRSAAGLVRQGAAQAVVTASFESPGAGTPLAALLAENGLEADAGEPLIVRRIVKADGGSRAYVNDQPASAGMLREIGQRLIEIHGQHDDRGLLNARGHRALLDAFARSDAGAVEAAWQHWRAAVDALEAARADVANAEADRDWLGHAIDELAKFAPEDGEEEALAAERTDMQKGARLSDDMETVMAAFTGSDGGLAQLRQAARRLDRIAPEHPLLAEALEALDRAVIEGSEAEEKLAQAEDALRYDPARLEAVETRLFELRALARKHRVAPDGLSDLLREFQARHARIEAGSEGLAVLEKDASAKRRAYEAAADALSKTRRAAANRLDAAVASELKPLKLDAARFRTVAETLPESHWGPAGKDRVEFEIATNPGAPFGALAKIASGGELSRFILALKVALAEEGGADTMIFDEIDRGVGGAVASAIGERLARLSDKAQLLVVTHSPQVAARGAGHLLIAKRSDGLVTRTNVNALDPASRREEIARMLSGAEVTDEARAQATRLLQAA
ncbi:DNA repair protein RecN (Recombination protein N) [Sphingomonas zeicaulis]|uniref:DNA repair protein RecN n=1 Tax=Sphingomonas zeicaulis TaxID=1632740 RepID=UPI003D1AA159